ncbi:hypothetical protein ACM55M_09880 [Flavobacterium sp. ZT3R25]|uniref:hypothetical protein n=1 Tax=Flavobacterium galactosi TaxID=3398735 RepID=UPI003A8A1BF0
MPIYYTNNGELFAWYKEDTIKKFRSKISSELIKTYGKGPFDEKRIVEILFFTLDLYQNDFLKILQNETELAFYQNLFLLHEFSSKIHQEKLNESYQGVINDKEFAIYRRILKLCLEQACDLKLNYNVEGSSEYLKSKEDVIDCLLYLGDHIYSYSNLLASQDLINDSVDLKFTPDDQFYFDFKHHYGYLITEVSKSYPDHIAEAVVGDDDFNDFVTALNSCLGIDYGAVVDTIKRIHEHLPGGKFTLDEPFIYPKNLENLYGIPFQHGETFFKGLTLNKDNKMSLKEAVYRPHNTTKYLYRPFLIWNVDGKDLTIVGDKIFIESIHSLCTNAFGWNKYPIEWENECFKKYIQSKVSKNDKILEDKAEKLLQENNVIYDRNLKYLKKWNHRNLNIDNDLCGEIDFLFIHNKSIYIADSKHLIARYDMNNFKNDSAYFERNKKAYNKTIKRKMNFLKANISDVQEHFQVKLNDKNLKIEDCTIEAIFIVNTPTFIMYNNEFRIYTLKSFRELLENTFIDQEYSLLIDEENNQKFLNVKYPYFQKPIYKVFDIKDYEDE